LESDQDAGCLGTKDVEGISEFRNAGQVLFIVRSAACAYAKLNNCAILCATKLSTACTASTKTSPTKPEKVGNTGFYLAMPSSSGNVLNVINDIPYFITGEEMNHQKKEKIRLLLEQVGSGIQKQKQELEVAYKAKSSPIVQINPALTILVEASP
jgi:hypothetical protein